MALKREYKGQEGYFFKSGNKKLRQDLATIEFAKRIKEGFAPAYLALFIAKDNESSTVFQIDNPRDVLDILCELGVNKPSEVKRLPVDKRRVVMYVEPNIGPNYGFCFTNKRKMPASIDRDGPYTSVVGEFHKLGNLEEQGFSLPEVKSYDSERPSVLVKEPPKRKLGEIVGGKMYVGEPSAHCLAVARDMQRAKDMQRKPVYSKTIYCRGPPNDLNPGMG